MIGTKLYQLELDGQDILIQAKVEYLTQKPLKFEEFIAQFEQAHLAMLTYFTQRVESLDAVIESLLDRAHGMKEDLPGNVTARQERLLWSYAK